jgi:hypothetical protein
MGVDSLLVARVGEHLEPFPKMPSASSREFEARLRGTEAEALRWPAEPDLFETVFDYAAPYVITVGFVRQDADDVPVPVEVTIRMTFPVSETGQGFVAGTEPRSLSTRDVRRLPLDRVVRAATAAADAGPVESASEFPKILLPRGRPVGGERSVVFYKKIAKAYRQLTEEQKSPAKEIARRKGVSENTAHQWIYKARLHGFLEPSPRSRKLGR